MSREWKPGDVAMVDWSSEQARANVGTRTSNSWAAIVSTCADGGWVDASDPDYFVRDSPQNRNWRNARPLVVIDPEDREQVDRLTKALVEGLYAAGFHALALNGIHPNNVQAALRSLTTPPKPEEPTGAAALVEDVGGDWWVRLSRGADGAVWHRIGIPEERLNWHQIAAVKVLSEGVTA